MTRIEWHSQAIGDHLRSDLSGAQQEVVLISPYVGLAPMQDLLHDLPVQVGVTLVTALDIAAAASGATDLRALFSLTERPSGVVRLLPRLHAKIYSRDWTSWWLGSSNFTNPGLGGVARANHEVLGNLQGPSAQVSDIARELLILSRTASLDMLKTLEAEVEHVVFEQRRDQEGSLEDLEKGIWAAMTNQAPPTYMLQEFPFLSGPHALTVAMSSPDGIAKDAWHDCFLFGVEVGDAEEVVISKCRKIFSEMPFMASLGAFLGTPRRFGEISAWLHAHCEDRPTPYRSEIKELASRLLDWLVVLFPNEYRRKRPYHSEYFGKVTGDWARISRSRGRSQP